MIAIASLKKRKITKSLVQELCSSPSRSVYRGKIEVKWINKRKKIEKKGPRNWFRRISRKVDARERKNRKSVVKVCLLCLKSLSNPRKKRKLNKLIAKLIWALSAPRMLVRPSHSKNLGLILSLSWRLVSEQIRVSGAHLNCRFRRIEQRISFEVKWNAEKRITYINVNIKWCW